MKFKRTAFIAAVVLFSVCLMLIQMSHTGISTVMTASNGKRVVTVDQSRAVFGRDQYIVTVSVDGIHQTQHCGSVPEFPNDRPNCLKWKSDSEVIITYEFGAKV